jgi:predicted small secreted protein
MLKKIALCLAVLASVALTACNTVEGAGRDVSAAGHAVTDTARDAKHY